MGGGRVGLRGWGRGLGVMGNKRRDGLVVGGFVLFVVKGEVVW